MAETQREPGVFLDTTIQHARNFKAIPHQRRIAKRLKTFGFTTTGAVVRQEFKRRVVGDAIYLFEQLTVLKNVKLLCFKVNNLPPAQNRKLRICNDLIATMGLEPAMSEEEQCERFLLQLKSFIETWRDVFDESVNLVRETSGCAASTSDVTAIKNGYDRPSKNCSDFPACGITSFVTSAECKAEIEKIKQKLSTTTQSKSDEIAGAEDFIDSLENATKHDVQSKRPCYTVGDFLISLESAKVPTFYTMNFKESKHFCRALGQNLIVLPSNFEHAEVEFSIESPEEWIMPKGAKCEDEDNQS